MTENVTYQKITLLGNLNNISFQTTISMLLVSENNMFLLQTHKLEILKMHYDHFSEVVKNSKSGRNLKWFTACLHTYSNISANKYDA